MSFGHYLKRVITVMLSSGLLVGVLFGGILMSQGQMSAEIDLTLDFGPLDGLWLPLLLPALAVLLAVMVSPLSYPVYKLLNRGGH